MFKTIKLIDLCCKDMAAIFKKEKYCFHSFHIGNTNDNFISVNETRKHDCLFFKACNNEIQVSTAFIEIILRIYLDIKKTFMEL